MTDNPCNCKSCGNRETNPNDDSFCKVTNEEISYIEEDLTLKCGCLAHSQAREYLLQSIIEKLEQQGNGIYSQRDVLKLLKEGIKK